MSSKIEEMAKQWASGQWDKAASPDDHRYAASCFAAGARAVFEEASKMAQRPNPKSMTQWDPFVYLAHIEALFAEQEAQRDGE